MSIRHEPPKKTNEWIVSQDFDKHRLDYWLKKKLLLFLTQHFVSL